MDGGKAGRVSRRSPQDGHGTRRLPSSDRAAGLAHAASLLLEAEEIRTIGDVVVEHICSQTGAIAAAFALYEEGDEVLRVISYQGFAPEVIRRYQRFSPGLHTPVAQILRSGKATVWNAHEFALTFPELGKLLPDEVFGCLIGIPLTSKGRAIGGMTAAYSFEEPLGRDIRAFLDAIGSAAGSAVERLRAIESGERRTAEAEALARVSRALMDARTMAQVGDIAWCEAASLLRADRGAFHLVDWKARELILVGRPGMSERLQEQSHRLALSYPTAATETALSGQPVLVESREDYAGRYPDSAADIYGRTGENLPGAALAVPVRNNADVLGTLSFGFRDGRLFNEHDIWLALSFANAAASAVERLRLFAAEQEARRHATALARASAALFEADDPAGVGRIALAEAQAITGAATGTITLYDPNDDTFYSIATFGVPAGRIATTRRPSGERSVVGDVIRESRTVVVENLDEYERRYPEFIDILREGGCRAIIGVPLIVRGRTIGAFSLAWDDRDRISEQEIALLESVGTTAAEAIERLRSHRLLEAVVAQMPAGVAVFDPRGQILAMNDQLAQLWHGNAAPGAVSNWTSWRAFRADGTPLKTTEWPIWRSLQSGELVIGESIPVERFDGTPGTLEFSSAPLRDEHGSVIAAVAVVSDVSGRVEAERAREAFLAVLSHELRTPITSILLAARRLDEKGDELEPDVRRGLTFDLEAEGERLNRVVSNLLVLSRVERGADLTANEPILLQHILPGIVKAEAKLWPDVRFELHMPTQLPMVHGEPGSIEQVVRNLMANAAKYGGDHVEVSARAGGDDVEIRVRDWGPGIQPDEMQRIFELFYRSSAMKQTAVGAGIGLFVVRNLVQAMGGRVWAEPADGSGACFVAALRRVSVEAV